MVAGKGVRVSTPIVVTIAKGAREDRVTVTRAAGVVMSFQFPKKGPLPHDAVHYVVESVMGLQQAFWGRIAAGQSPDAIQQLAHAGGHPSAKRAGAPTPDIVEMLQAERLVECLEADAWSGGAGDLPTFSEVYAAACAQSSVAPLPLEEEDLSRLRAVMQELARQWAGGSYRFEF